ncbi:hypothetical protein [Dyella caseinilytica]|uniref:Transcriptional regulator n=1 Tax=Dyella caseinilytica TaxID=1849581 RepID=A0ABX7GP34_9GAMM|nr:hypothetical protein [Dyella caseinilytica]QRN52180.1 hypothetical protein ISN74_11795 [Dyella caseinilytica]GGA13923.1 hypothetical protein GCM10011408_39360 [Dyella caseinilytica]
MQIVTRLIAMTRARQLQRQFQQIERSIASLPARTRSRLAIMTLREIGQASKCEFPHLYSTAPDQRYAPWGQGTEIGFSRAQSENPEVALRGIALWLAVAYHETKETPHTSLQPQHRQLLRVLRELRDAGSEPADATTQWMRSGAAA